MFRNGTSSTPNFKGLFINLSSFVHFGDFIGFGGFKTPVTKMKLLLQSVSSMYSMEEVQHIDDPTTKSNFQFFFSNHSRILKVATQAQKLRGIFEIR